MAECSDVRDLKRNLPRQFPPYLEAGIYDPERLIIEPAPQGSTLAVIESRIDDRVSGRETQRKRSVPVVGGRHAIVKPARRSSHVVTIRGIRRRVRANVFLRPVRSVTDAAESPHNSFGID